MFFNSSVTRKSLKSIASGAIWVSVVGYFVFHIFNGARGAISWARLSKEIVFLENKLKKIKEENEFLENKINFIKSSNLDLDLLEEQAQNIIGFFNKNDIIVLLPRYNGT